MSLPDPRSLAAWFVEQLRKPAAPKADAEHEAFEARKEALLHIWHIRRGKKPATARTRAEMEFAAGLEPCPRCGHLGIGSTGLTGAGTSWTLTATCPSCGTPRSFTYATQGDPTQAPPHGADELSHLPSFLIPAESFQAELQRLLPLVNDDPAARQRALVCANEIAKLTEPRSETRAEPSSHPPPPAQPPLKPAAPRAPARPSAPPVRPAPAAKPHSVKAPPVDLSAHGPAYARVLAEPSSIPAREALAAEWRAANDPRAALVEKQLRLREFYLARSRYADEAIRLFDEIRELLRQHGEQWAGEIAPVVKNYKFHRGCLAEVTLSGAAFPALMPKLVALAPVQHVNLTAPLEFAAVAASPLLARVTSLHIIGFGKDFGDAEAKLLAGSEHVRNLRYLSLDGNAIDREGVVALAASPYLAGCLYLSLDGNPLNVTPVISDWTGIYQAHRSAFAEELDTKYGPLQWLALPDLDGSWPPDRDDAATMA
jgi:hypothetical protein